MVRSLVFSAAALAGLLVAGAQTAQAQAYIVGYAPPVYVQPAPVVVARPVYAVPAYYYPPPVVVQQPVIYPAPPVVVAQPVLVPRPVYTTRYRVFPHRVRVVHRRW